MRAALASIALGTLGLAYVLIARGFPATARRLPTILGVTFLVVLVMYVVQEFNLLAKVRGRTSDRDRGQREETRSVLSEDTGDEDTVSIPFAFALMVVVTVALYYLGFVVGGSLFVLAALWIKNPGHRHRAMPFGVVAVIALAILFERILSIPLWRGVLL